ncbi:glycosyltransferase family 39 protein [uncultured Tenacibaculum sp.]|uniref:ArnT family glycosyltransferase n=1 Tax=uncultured Tenacibaculum sp. TaxID=174713 RepID=UPI0026209A59|nr:glycosyltransferase family 39 protein [uncultured Tenacibaculum sp.]
MKAILTSKYTVPVFLFLLFILNVIQGYLTELLADEAYYWAYSNNLDWGYFDHPPMIALWITISKFFFSSGELSIRFFSAITLSLTFYFVWTLIKHPEKNKHTGLFLLLLTTTVLFNVYGFITVPDTPLLFFFVLFLVGYQKYISEQKFSSYTIIAIAMAGMLYSKYQAVLIIFFVLLSNLKVLKDWKIWATTLATIVLFFPHLYWQYLNDFASIKYHLFERNTKSYRIDYTTNHILNLIAIIGLTFPIVYLAFFKRIRVKDQFEKALRFLVIGFAIFFFISSFKSRVQAQWVVPISIPLIIIPFYYLIDNPKKIKAFKILASITLLATIALRIIVANDGLVPKQFEMHGNKKWVKKLDQQLANRTPLFLNSYQNTSLYWFYSGKKPLQINSWRSRKNQYDLYDYNQNFDLNKFALVTFNKTGNATDSLIKKNKSLLYIETNTNGYKKRSKAQFELINPIVNKEKESVISVSYDSNLISELDKLELQIIFKAQRSRAVTKAKLVNNTVVFTTPKLNWIPTHIQIAGTTNTKVIPLRFSKMTECLFKE